MSIQDTALALASAAFPAINAAAEKTAEGIDVGLGSVTDFFAAVPKGAKKAAPTGTIPFQGPLPPDVSDLMAELSRELGLDAPAVAYASDRAAKSGYNAKAKNAGGLRCLLAHAHGQDGACVSCSDEKGRVSFLRCYASDEEGMRRLLTVARARTLGGPIAPICPTCKTHDAQPTAGVGGIGPVIVGAFLALVAAAGAATYEADKIVVELRKSGIDIVKPGAEPPDGWTIVEPTDGSDPVRTAFVAVLGDSLGNRALRFAVSKGWRYARPPSGVAGDIVDDIVTAWDFCKFCRKVGATVGGAESESEDFASILGGEEEGGEAYQAPVVADNIGTICDAQFVQCRFPGMPSAEEDPDFNTEILRRLIKRGRASRDDLATLTGNLGSIVFATGPDVGIDEAFAAISTAHAMIDAGEQGDPLALVRAAKKALAEKLHGKAWLRGVGIGLDERGGVVKVNVQRITSKVRKAVPESVSAPGSDVVFPVVLAEIGDVVAQDDVGYVSDVGTALSAPGLMNQIMDLAPGGEIVFEVPLWGCFAAVRRSDNESDDDFISAMANEGGPPDVGGYRSLEIHSRSAPDETGESDPFENLGAAEPESPDEKSFRLLSQAWAPILAWFPTADATCPCKTQVAPLVESWRAYAKAHESYNCARATYEDGTPYPSTPGPTGTAPPRELRPGGVCDPAQLRAQWDGLKTAIKLRQRYAPADDDATSDVSGWFDDAAKWVASPFTDNAPTAALEGKIQEVAAAWATIEPKMKADPKLARTNKILYDHWIQFYKDWQAGKKDVDDSRSITLEVNVARRNALGIDQTQDKGTISEVDIEAERKAEIQKNIDDKKKTAGGALSSAGKWIAAGAAATVAAIVAVKAAL